MSGPGRPCRPTILQVGVFPLPARPGWCRPVLTASMAVRAWSAMSADDIAGRGLPSTSPARMVSSGADSVDAYEIAGRRRVIAPSCPAWPRFGTFWATDVHPVLGKRVRNSRQASCDSTILSGMAALRHILGHRCSPGPGSMPSTLPAPRISRSFNATAMPRAQLIVPARSSPNRLDAEHVAGTADL